MKTHGISMKQCTKHVRPLGGATRVNSLSNEADIATINYPLIYKYITMLVVIEGEYSLFCTTLTKTLIWTLKCLNVISFEKHQFKWH